MPHLAAICRPDFWGPALGQPAPWAQYAASPESPLMQSANHQYIFYLHVYLLSYMYILYTDDKDKE